jgi:hypothetical protein
MTATTHDQTFTVPVTAPARAGALARTMTLLLGWFFVALTLTLAGVFVGNGGPPVGIGLALGLPLVAYWLDGRRGHPLFGGLAQLDAPTLALLQSFRVLGVVFLIAWWRGALPAGFALPAGIGDVTVGVTAPFVARALAGGKPWARRLFVGWSIFGLADLVVAVASGVTHAQGVLGLFATVPSTNALASYPFSIIPTFLVPIAVMMHVAGLRAVARNRPRI